MKKFRYTDEEINDWCKTQSNPWFPKYAGMAYAIPRKIVYDYAIELAERAKAEDGFDFYNHGYSDEAESYRICVDLYARQVENSIYANFPEFLEYLNDSVEDFYSIALNDSAPCEMFTSNEWKDWVKQEIERDYKELNRQPDECLSERQKKQLGDLAFLVAEYCCD